VGGAGGACGLHLSTCKKKGVSRAFLIEMGVNGSMSADQSARRQVDPPKKRNRTRRDLGNEIGSFTARPALSPIDRRRRDVFPNAVHRQRDGVPLAGLRCVPAYSASFH